jgi:hypothetical protein
MSRSASVEMRPRRNRPTASALVFDDRSTTFNVVTIAQFWSFARSRDPQGGRGVALSLAWVGLAVIVGRGYMRRSTAARAPFSGR